MIGEDISSRCLDVISLHHAGPPRYFQQLRLRRRCSTRSSACARLPTVATPDQAPIGVPSKLDAFQQRLQIIPATVSVRHDQPSSREIARTGSSPEPFAWCRSYAAIRNFGEAQVIGDAREAMSQDMRCTSQERRVSSGVSSNFREVAHCIVDPLAGEDIGACSR